MIWPLIIGPLAEIVNTVIKRVLPEQISEAERAKFEAELTLELAKMDWQTIEGQLQTNVEEAKHTSVFVAGWRPFVGWVCGTSLAYNFILQPLATWVVAVWAWQTPPLPELDTTGLLTVLAGMLGLAGMRSYERVMGVTTTGKGNG